MVNSEFDDLKNARANLTHNQCDQEGLSIKNLLKDYDQIIMNIDDIKENINFLPYPLIEDSRHIRLMICILRYDLRFI